MTDADVAEPPEPIAAQPPAYHATLDALAAMQRANDAKPHRVLPPIRPNASLRIKYQNRLETLLDEMQASLTYWLVARYKNNPPEMAADASPAMTLRRAMRTLARQWLRRFDEAAPKLATYFATAASERVDGSLRTILKQAGFTVAFKASAAQNDALQATIGENVSLIKSIASEHLTDIEGMVMRSVAAGHDLGQLAKGLQEHYGVARRRAALIARDQNNKATATLERVRQTELGITRAIWLHSHGGKTPRPTHLANNGKAYSVAEGWLDPDPRVNARIWPGQLINCRCLCRSILPTL